MVRKMSKIIPVNFKLENRVDLREFFLRDRLSRIILEGGYQSSWRKTHLDIGEFLIPEGTLRIHPGVDYDLDLIARLGSNGKMEKVSVEPKETLEIDYNFFLYINRPRGLLVEDGRLFYDRSLLIEQPDLAVNFLMYFEQQYKEGKSFHQIYLRIKEKRER